MELRVEREMAGMCPIMPPGRMRPGYDDVPRRNYAIVICLWKLLMPPAAMPVTLTAADKIVKKPVQEGEDVLAGPAAAADRADRRTRLGRCPGSPPTLALASIRCASGTAGSPGGG